MNRKDMQKLENEVREKALAPLRRELRKRGISLEDSYSYGVLYDRVVAFAEAAAQSVDQIVATRGDGAMRRVRAARRVA